MQDPAPPWRPGEHRRLPVSREWRESRTRGSRSSIAGASTGREVVESPRDVPRGAGFQLRMRRFAEPEQEERPRYTYRAAVFVEREREIMARYFGGIQG